MTDTAVALPEMIIPAAKLEALEKIAADYAIVKFGAVGALTSAIGVATGIQKLDEALTAEVMAPIMKLQGTPLGFLTDKDRDGGYPVAVVKRCTIEGLLRGARPVLNEMNIISGRWYGTLEYFRRIMRDYPGLTSLNLEYGVPRGSAGGAVTQARGSWVLNGQAMRFPFDPTKPEEFGWAEIPVKVNQGMGADAILGKVERKLRARIFSRITGTEWGDAEPSEEQRFANAKPVGDKTTTLVDRLRAEGGSGEPIFGGGEEAAESAAAVEAEGRAVLAPEKVTLLLELIAAKPAVSQDQVGKALGQPGKLLDELEGNPGETAAALYTRVLQEVQRIKGR